MTEHSVPHRLTIGVEGNGTNLADLDSPRETLAYFSAYLEALLDLGKRLKSPVKLTGLRLRRGSALLETKPSVDITQIDEFLRDELANPDTDFAGVKQLRQAVKRLPGAYIPFSDLGAGRQAVEVNIPAPRFSRERTTVRGEILQVGGTRRHRITLRVKAEGRSISFYADENTTTEAGKHLFTKVDADVILRRAGKRFVGSTLVAFRPLEHATAEEEITFWRHAIRSSSTDWDSIEDIEDYLRREGSQRRD